MSKKESLTTPLLYLAMLGQIVVLGWFFYAFIWPVFPRISPLTRTAITGLFVGIPYYFSAFFAFMKQEKSTGSSASDITIMGRIFKPDLRFFNPTNHLITATMVIFTGLALLAASRL